MRSRLVSVFVKAPAFLPRFTHTRLWRRGYEGKGTSGVRACPSKKGRSEWWGKVSTLATARKHPEVFSRVFHTCPNSLNNLLWSCNPGTLLSGRRCTMPLPDFPHSLQRVLQHSFALYLCICECSHGPWLCWRSVCFTESTFTLSQLWPRIFLYHSLPL